VLIVGVDLSTPISQLIVMLRTISQLIVMLERNYLIVQIAKQVFQDKQIV